MSDLNPYESAVEGVNPYDIPETAWDKAKKLGGNFIQNLNDTLHGVAEAGGTIVTGIPAAVAGKVAGDYTQAITAAAKMMGYMPDVDPVEAGKAVSAGVSKDMTFQPTTPFGKHIIEKLGPVLAAPGEIGGEMFDLPAESLKLSESTRQPLKTTAEFAAYPAAGKVGGFAKNLVKGVLKERGILGADVRELKPATNEQIIKDTKTLDAVEKADEIIANAPEKAAFAENPYEFAAVQEEPAVIVPKTEVTPQTQALDLVGQVRDKLPTWDVERLESLATKDPLQWDASDKLFLKDVQEKFGETAVEGIDKSRGEEYKAQGYREIGSDEVLEPGADVKMDMATGKNYVKEVVKNPYEVVAESGDFVKSERLEKEVGVRRKQERSKIDQMAGEEPPDNSTRGEIQEGASVSLGSEDQRTSLGLDAEERASGYFFDTDKPAPEKKSILRNQRGSVGRDITNTIGPFYSQLNKTVDAKMRMSMPVEQLHKMLRNNGVTEAEAGEILAGLKGNVTKQQVLDAVAEKGVEFKDVVLGEQGTSEMSHLAEIQDGPDKGWWQVIRADGRPLNGMWRTREEASRVHDEMIPESEWFSKSQNPVRFPTWVEPGAKEGSYREMFVTAPRKTLSPEQMKSMTDAEVKAEYDRLNPTEWQDGHDPYSDIQNPIVRIRFNERDVNGKRVLFVEEIQGPSKENQAKMPESLRNRIYDIGVKRILTYAKENGFDEVAWTTGDMQASRYDLSKHIKKVDWETSDINGIKSIYLEDVNGKTLPPIQVDAKGKSISEYGTFANKSLDEIIGKELASKIISDSKGELRGLDLKVGGEGLKRLYDETLPGLFKKYGRDEVKKNTIPGLVTGWESVHVIKTGQDTYRLTITPTPTRSTVRVTTPYSKEVNGIELREIIGEKLARDIEGESYKVNPEVLNKTFSENITNPFDGEVVINKGDVVTAGRIEYLTSLGLERLKIDGKWRTDFADVPEITFTKGDLDASGLGDYKVSSIPISAKTPSSFTLYSDPLLLQTAWENLTKGDKEVHDYYKWAKENKVIVDTYDPATFGDRLPDRTVTLIPEDPPKVSIAKDISNELARKLSPSFTFRKIFGIDSPSIDWFKSRMSASENTKNAMLFAKNALKDIPDNFSEIFDRVKPLFDKNKVMIDEYTLLNDEKTYLIRRLNRIPESAEYNRLSRQVLKLEKERAKVQEKLNKKDSEQARDDFLVAKEERIKKAQERIDNLKSEKASMRQTWAMEALEREKAKTFDREISSLMAKEQRLSKAIEKRVERAEDLRSSIGRIKDFTELKAKIAGVNAEIAALTKSPRFKKMNAEHEALLTELAQKYPDARVFLAAADELPEGIKLSQQEAKAVSQLRKYQEGTRDRLEELGIPVIKEKGYMTHLYKQLLADTEGYNVVDKFQIKPTLLSFMSRLPNTKSWLPSAHEAMRSYIPVAEYKIAYQPFLDRWRPFIDKIKQPQLQKFMNDWIAENMNKKDIGFGEKLLNAAVGLEYARTIGLSMSVGFKHGMKVLGTFAEYGPSRALQAGTHVTLVPFQSSMQFGRLHFNDFRKAADRIGVTNKTEQLDLFRHFVNQSDLVRMITEIPGFEAMDRTIFAGPLAKFSGRIAERFGGREAKGKVERGVFNVSSTAIDSVGKVLGQPVKTVEAIDNGITVFSGIIGGMKKGVDPKIIERHIWDSILKINFRAGADQPLAQKGAGVRGLTMFQMTPLKLQERLFQWVHDSIVLDKDPVTGKILGIGKKDAFGTYGGAKLARFLLMVGTAEMIARQNDTSVFGMAMAHLPFVGEVFKPKKEGIGFEFELKPTGISSPLLQYAYQMSQKGAVEGTKEHLKEGFNFWSKIEKAKTEEYPTKYQSVAKYLLGLPRVQGENDLETVMEKQKEERKEQKETVDKLGAKFARGEEEAAVKVIEYIETQPEEDQDRLANHFMQQVELHKTTEHKWWQGITGLSPENKAKVFFERFKKGDDEEKLYMIETAERLGGFTSDRFSAALAKEIEKHEGGKE